VFKKKLENARNLTKIKRIQTRERNAVLKNVIVFAIWSLVLSYATLNLISDLLSSCVYYYATCASIHFKFFKANLMNFLCFEILCD